MATEQDDPAPQYVFDDDSSLVDGDNRLQFDTIQSAGDVVGEQDLDMPAHFEEIRLPDLDRMEEVREELAPYADDIRMEDSVQDGGEGYGEVDAREMVSEPGTPAMAPVPVDGGESMLERVQEVVMPPRNEIPLPCIAPPPSSVVLVDMAAMTSVIQFEVTRRRYLRWWMQAVLYFVLVVVIAMLQINVSDTHQMATLVKNTFIEPTVTETGSQRLLRDITNVEDVHLWLRNVWAPGIFTDVSSDAVSDTSQAVIAAYNKVAVNPYLHMKKRSTTSGCDQYIFSPSYCRDGTSTGVYIRNGRQYSPIDSLDNPSSSGDGFYAVFRVNTNGYGALDGNHTVFDGTSVAAVRGHLQVLKQDNWFDEESTFLEAPIVIYNPEYDLLTIYKVVFEVTDGGGVIPSARGSVLQTTRLDWISTDQDRARWGLEFVFMAATFLEAVSKGIQIRRARRRGASVLAYFTSRAWAWNCFEILSVLVALTAFSLHTRLMDDKPSLPSRLQVLDGKIDIPSQLLIASRAVNSVLIILCGVKVMRYFGFVPGWRVLLLALEKALPPLSAFLLLLVVISIGFACSGYYVLGNSNGSFGGTLQDVLSFYTRKVEALSVSGVAADTTYGAFPTMWYWLLFVVMVVIGVGMVVGIAVAALKAARNELKELAEVRHAAKRWKEVAPRKEWWNYIPGGSVFNTLPKSLIEVFGVEGKRWIVPLMIDYTATSKLIAEVGGGNLRVYIGVEKWFRRKLVGARGLAVTLPHGSLVSTTKYHKGFMAKVRPGQALHLTTEPLLGVSEIEFVVEGNTLRTKGEVDLGMSDHREVIIEFPRVINENFAWPQNEVVVSVDTVHRLATYGGCFTYSPADWIVCSVATPSALDICPYLVTEPFVPLEDILQAIEHAAVEIPASTWRHSITSLAQMFSKTVEAPLATYSSPYANPLDTESTWNRGRTARGRDHYSKQSRT